MSKERTTRRDFLRMGATTTLAAGIAPTILSWSDEMAGRRPIPIRSANDNLRIATIGVGIIGFIDTNTALEVPGTELVAVADLYQGRLDRAKEVYGSEIMTTRDYREILARDDIDAVLVCTPDHWHQKITIDALESGKAVYCEKPMVHLVEQGQAMIDAERKTGNVLQIGSQFASSMLFWKARELVQSGAIGEVNLVESAYNRNSSLGAWQYSIPPDASPETVDWDTFLHYAPKREFDPVRFFRWRNYNDYGTGVAGDLFIHLLTGIHLVTDSHGPTSVASMGGVRFSTLR